MINGYFLAALVGLLCVEAIRWTALWVNLRALTSDPPPELADVYDPQVYRRSQEYTRVTTRMGLARSLADLAVLLAFWFAGCFGAVDGSVRSWGLGPVSTGLCFFAILAFARGVLALPFDIHAVFVVEERFGFNRTSPRTFLLDRLKGLALGAVVGIPLAAGFLALYVHGGPYAWIGVWAAVVAFSIVLQVLAPSLIMPLFNRFTPLEAGALRDAILAYAERVRFPLTGVFSIDASRRSSKGNAFFTGIGKRKRIALFDTLIARHPTEELVAILAHEVGHYRRRHVLVGTCVSALEVGLFLGLFAVLRDQAALFAAFGVDEPSVHAGVVCVAILLEPLQWLLSVGAAALSRYHERQADRFAAETTGRGDLLASGLKRLARDNLTNLTPHPFFVLLHYSHPPLRERIRALAPPPAR